MVQLSRSWLGYLVVYSTSPKFVSEADVVRGYVASGEAAPGSVHVRSPMGTGNFAEYADHAELFDVAFDSSADWEVSYYRSLVACDGVLVMGGGRSTFVTGLIALRGVCRCWRCPGSGALRGRCGERLFHRDRAVRG